MPTLATTVDGLKLPNLFVIGSGPPGTNLNVVTRVSRRLGRAVPKLHQTMSKPAPRWERRG